jgi:hypothetical protein
MWVTPERDSAPPNSVSCRQETSEVVEEEAEEEAAE